MKYISKKDFIATRKVEQTTDLERRLGLMTGDVSGDYVYTYLDDSVYISANRGDEYQYEVLVGREYKTFKTLKKAEKCLYKYLKESEMEEELCQYDVLEVVHEISSFIGFNASRYVKCRKVIQGNESVDTFIDINSTFERIHIIDEMARGFLIRRKSLTEKELDETDFLDDIKLLCEERFPSKNKQMELINPVGYIEYLIIEFMSNLKDNEKFDSLNGFDGQTTKANELVAKFKKEYKDVSWGENGFDSMPNELECFLEREFGMAEKKEFQVIQKVLITKYVNVEAYTEGEAGDIGIDMIKNKDYLEDNIDVQSFEVNELK